jgi:hypothetical protein
MEFAIMPITPTIMIPALACDTARDGAPLRMSDDSVVPAEVLADARRVADGLYHNRAKADEVYRQLIGTYLAVKDTDVAIIFCPGGWGWSSITRSPGWVSIQNGIQDVLQSYGQSAIAIDYERTDRSLSGVISEFVVLVGISPFKARELAQRIEFLTRHLPGLKVLLTGESNGAAMTEDTMRLLRRNPRVYAIRAFPDHSPQRHRAGHLYQRRYPAHDPGQCASTLWQIQGRAGQYPSSHRGAGSCLRLGFQGCAAGDYGFSGETLRAGIRRMVKTSGGSISSSPHRSSLPIYPRPPGEGLRVRA